MWNLKPAQTYVYIVFHVIHTSTVLGIYTSCVYVPELLIAQSDKYIKKNIADKMR